MKTHLKSILTLATVLVAGVALADTTTEKTQQRDVNQQQRIEQGLKSGELSTKEAGKLEREESAVSRMQSRSLRDGTVSDAEAARLKQAQDKVSADIHDQKHDAQHGNPDSLSSTRLQNDVQRNVNQQQRIQNGLQNGSVTEREAARLEHGQARVDKKQANAAADGRVGKAEQNRIRRTENRKSRQIFRKKHNAAAT